MTNVAISSHVRPNRKTGTQKIQTRLQTYLLLLLLNTLLLVLKPQLKALLDKGLTIPRLERSIGNPVSSHDDLLAANFAHLHSLTLTRLETNSSP